MPLGLTKKQDFSNFRGLLGRSERSLSLAAPQGNAARLCDRSAHPLRGAALRATLYAKGHSEMFLLLLPSLALLVFSCPFCTISHSPSLQCVPLPLHCDWPNIILNPHKWEGGGRLLKADGAYATYVLSHRTNNAMVFDPKILRVGLQSIGVGEVFKTTTAQNTSPGTLKTH